MLIHLHCMQASWIGSCGAHAWCPLRLNYGHPSSSSVRLPSQVRSQNPVRARCNMHAMVGNQASANHPPSRPYACCSMTHRLPVCVVGACCNHAMHAHCQHAVDLLRSLVGLQALHERQEQCAASWCQPGDLGDMWLALPPLLPQSSFAQQAGMHARAS